MKKYFLIVFILEFAAINSTAFSQVQISGNLTTYIDDFIANLPSTYGGNQYQPPSSSDLTLWANAISYILQGNYSFAHSTADGIGYRLVEYTDNSVSPNKKYYILEKKSSSSNHWGMFIYNPIALRTKLFIQSPHPKYDSYTGKQGFYIFKNQSCRALFISGTHRCNNSTPTTCSGTSQVCTGQDDPYKISDQAHVVNGTLQKVTEVLNSAISNLYVIQVHGFDQDTGDPDLIISNGTRYTPNPDYIPVLRDNLLIIDNLLTFKIAHIDLSWTKLIATVNTQGRFINQSSDPCSQSASTSTGRFIHVEQSYNLRNTTTARKKLSDAIGMTFPANALVLTSPNGNEVLTSGSISNITWTTSGLTSNIKLEYSINNGLSWTTITPNTNNTGSFAWSVPNIGTWRARVRIFDAEYSSIGDTSNSQFKIKHSVYSTTGQTLFVDPAAAFGSRKLNGTYDFHRGMDFAGTYNIPIRPAMAGVIVRKEDSTMTAGTGLQRFGNWILVRIDSIGAEPRHNAYLHLNGFYNYNVGDTVSTLDTIGFMGKSGYEINTIHLHLELYKNLLGTTIDKDKAKNPIEILPYTNSNAYLVSFLTSGDSSAVQVSIPDTELDFDAVTIYGSLSSKIVGFNSRTGIDPINNDNPNYNGVFIDPDSFITDSSVHRIGFWTKNGEVGNIDSVKVVDVNGYSFTFSQSSVGQRYAVTTGNWTGSIWAWAPGGVAGSASTPLNINDVTINSGITVTINSPTAECNSVSFGSSTSKIIFSSGSILNVHGDFTLATTTHNAFSAWAAGAKLRFTGNRSVQTIRRLYKDASTFSSSFMELIIDKPIGKVTTEDSVRVNIGTIMEIVSGSFELGYRADIEGRNLTGTTATTPTITIQAAGKFEMVGSLSHIRSGNSGTNPIGKMTVYGTSFLRTTSSNGLAIGGIDVKDGGILYLDSFSSGSANLIKTGVVNVESGGKAQVNTIISFWHSSSSVNLQSDGSYILNSNPPNIDYTFPLSFTNNGIVEYSYSGNQTIKAIPYRSLKISGTGNKTLIGNINIDNLLDVSGGNLITGVYKITLSSSSTVSENPASVVLGKLETTRSLSQGINNTFGGIGIEINAIGNSPGETYVQRVTDTILTSNGNKSIQRYFHVLPSENDSLNANLIFHYNQSELNTIPEANLNLFKSSNLNGLWDLKGGTVDTSDNSILLIGVNEFSFWTAANIDSPLSIRKLNLTAFIQGLYNGTVMVSDTVLVELHNSTAPFILVESIKTVLNNSGYGTVDFVTVTDATNYFVAIKHRNAIESWSKTLLQFTNGVLNYNFSSSQDKTYGDNSVLVGSKWCFFSGDVAKDGIIDLSDVGAVDTDNLNFQTGYIVSDVTGDNLVDISDVALVDSNNLNFISRQTPEISEKIKKILRQRHINNMHQNQEY